jgi:hypothetical protein
MFTNDISKGHSPARRFKSAVSGLALALTGISLLATGPAGLAQEPATATRSAAAVDLQGSADDSRMMAATLPPPGRCVPPPPDMDAWYPFDGNGTDLILGKNATAVGPVGYPGAVVQAGAQLGSAASYFSIAPGPVLNQGLGDFSIDMWLFVPPHWLPGPHPVRTLVEKRTNSGGVRGYSLFIYNSRLGLQLADGVHTNIGQPPASTPLTAGWNHIAVTVDRDNPKGVVFYRNAAITSSGDPTARQGNLDNNAPTLIGRNAFGDGGTSERAIFDEIEFFDRVLQPAEVKMIFAAGRAGKCKR